MVILLPMSEMVSIVVILYIMVWTYYIGEQVLVTIGTQMHNNGIWLLIIVQCLLKIVKKSQGDPMPL